MIPQLRLAFTAGFLLFGVTGPTLAQGVLIQWPSPSPSGLGDVAATGDLNGDGVGDLACTQPNPTTTGIGRLIIRSGVDLSIPSNIPVAQPGAGPGSVFFARVWYRDPGFPAPNDVGLTPALGITLWP